MNIYESIAAVMGEIGAVGKDSLNEQQKFKFRGIDAVMNAINPALVKNKVFIVPEILEQLREERKSSKGGLLIYSVCKIRYRFYAEDGSYVDAVVIGEGMDSGDKATNKAMSIAFKYACFQVFCIPTEEMKDPDAECHEVAPKEEPKEDPKVAEQLTDTEIDKVKVMKIDKVKVAALVNACKERGIEQEKIMKLYKVSSLADLTEAQFVNICEHWEQIKNA